MTHGEIARESVIVGGTVALSGALFWMAIFLAGPIPVFPGAGVLLLALAWSLRRMTSGWRLAERAAVACLFAAQASLLTAVILKVLPAFVRGVI